MKVRIYIALFLALTPAMAFARPKTATARMRPQLFRDRTPKVRVSDARVRTVRVKNAPVVQKEESPF